MRSVRRPCVTTADGRAVTRMSAAPVDRWPISALPPRLRGYLVAVETLAVIWPIAAIARLDVSAASAWGVLALLLALALAYEEASTRVARLRYRFGPALTADMTSVWIIAAAVALPAGHAVLLIVAIRSYTWLRHRRPQGQPAYKEVFTSATVLLGALFGTVAMHTMEHTWPTWPVALASAASVVVALLVFAVVSRVLVTGAAWGVGVRGRQLLGSREDNLNELATLCLGGLVSLAAQQEPWLAVLALPPMIALQRGSWVRELETAATTDDKTGLLNAVTWQAVATRELVRAARTGGSLAVLLLDIDRFKAVNDRFGHLAGDLVLRGVGRCVAETVREYDTVGRFGGEEFVVVLPLANDADALAIAERVRASIEQLHVSDFVDDTVSISGAPVGASADDGLAVSIGVSCAPHDGDDISTLLLAADSALYRAKANGRNRVVLAERGLPDTVTA